MLTSSGSPESRPAPDRRGESCGRTLTTPSVRPSPSSYLHYVVLGTGCFEGQGFKILGFKCKTYSFINAIVTKNQRFEASDCMTSHGGGSLEQGAPYKCTRSDPSASSEGLATWNPGPVSERLTHVSYTTLQRHRELPTLVNTGFCYTFTVCRGL